MKDRNNSPFELLTDRDVEREYKILRSTQKTWRWKRNKGKADYNGFPFIKIGRIVRYRRADLEAWIAGKEPAHKKVH